MQRRRSDFGEDRNGLTDEDINTHLVPLDELSSFLQTASANHLLINNKADLGALSLLNKNL